MPHFSNAKFFFRCGTDLDLAVITRPSAEIGYRSCANELQPGHRREDRDLSQLGRVLPEMRIAKLAH